MSFPYLVKRAARKEFRFFFIADVVKNNQNEKNKTPSAAFAKTEGVFESLEYIATDCIIASSHPFHEKYGESSQTQ